MTAPATTAETVNAQRSQLTQRLITMLGVLFAGMGSWRDADADRFAAQAAPLVAGAQQTLARLVALSLALQAGMATGQTVAPPVLSNAAISNLRPVSGREVYRRPFRHVWAALAEGKSLREALQQGQSRLAEIAEGDMQLAYAHANREGMQALPQSVRPRSWRRVLQGESSCALCVLASTHRYTRGDLNPIHPNCDCTVEPIFGRDTHRVVDDAMLERLHAAVAELTGDSSRSGRGSDYRQIQITRTHGELGPMLARPGDRFTGPEQIPQ